MERSENGSGERRSEKGCGGARNLSILGHKRILLDAHGRQDGVMREERERKGRGRRWRERRAARPSERSRGGSPTGRG